jgi:hypothetical protein
MTVNLSISNIVGIPPFEVYMCDSNVNNCQLVDTLYDPVYWPTVIDLPSSLTGSTTIFVKIVDSNLCETFKFISCSNS